MYFYLQEYANSLTNKLLLNSKRKKWVKNKKIKDNTNRGDKWVSKFFFHEVPTLFANITFAFFNKNIESSIFKLLVKMNKNKTEKNLWRLSFQSNFFFECYWHPLLAFIYILHIHMFLNILTSINYEHTADYYFSPHVIPCSGV